VKHDTTKLFWLIYQVRQQR